MSSVKYDRLNDTATIQFAHDLSGISNESSSDPDKYDLARTALGHQQRLMSQTPSRSEAYDNFAGTARLLSNSDTGFFRGVGYAISRGIGSTLASQARQGNSTVDQINRGVPGVGLDIAKSTISQNNENSVRQGEAGSTIGTAIGSLGFLAGPAIGALTTALGSAAGFALGSASARSNPIPDSINTFEGGVSPDNASIAYAHSSEGSDSSPILSQ